MSTSTAALDWLFQRASSDSGIDRKALAGLLAELARNIEPDFRLHATDVAPIDPRLEQLRTLLVGREIEVLARLSEVLEDPEQLATAVGRVLPAALAQAATDARLAEVLAPTVEKATRNSIRKDPRTLVNILHPLIIPAIRKSIGEAIDETFQSLNESLKHSLTWRGLKWRWEAWRTGTSFAAVVLKHTLAYQVEHVFLVHRHTGLLIAHVAARDAASQDPQLVSSMLVAIQDFVRDSFAGAEHQGLDALRLGELRLWSEPGPFATLVAVIRGNPPEGLHDILRGLLSTVHADRSEALENFDGDSSGLADIEAQLSAGVALRQQLPQAAVRGRGPKPMALIGLVLVVLVSMWGAHAWNAARVWQGYLSRLRSRPGIVITETGRRDGKYFVAGLRDPLADDPGKILLDARLEPSKIISQWAPYQSLEPELVLRRLRLSLAPPPSVTLAVSGANILARGSAPSTWLVRARAAARLLPVGTPALDLSRVHDFNDGAIGRLREQIQAHDIHFNNNEPLPAPDQDAILDELATELNRLASLSSTMRVVTRVTLTGHSDATGQGTFNLSLSLARAEAVLAVLKKRGVDPDLLAVRAAGPLEPEEAETSDAARSVNRRVSITVGFEEQ